MRFRCSRVGLSSCISPAWSCRYWIYASSCVCTCVCRAHCMHGDICRNVKNRQFSSFSLCSNTQHTLAKCKSLAVNVKYTQRINFVHNGPNRIADKAPYTRSQNIFILNRCISNVEKGYKDMAIQWLLLCVIMPITEFYVVIFENESKQ